MYEKNFQICKQYNAPQLHAIAAACRICAPAMLSTNATNIVPPPSKDDGPVMLLQGPPGNAVLLTHDNSPSSFI